MASSSRLHNNVTQMHSFSQVIVIGAASAFLRSCCQHFVLSRPITSSLNFLLLKNLSKFYPQQLLQFISLTHQKQTQHLYKTAQDIHNVRVVQAKWSYFMSTVRKLSKVYRAVSLFSASFKNNDYKFALLWGEAQL